MQRPPTASQWSSINLFKLPPEDCFTLPPEPSKQLRRYVSRKKVTPSENIKKNMLKIQQKRRKSKLKEVTEQNLKMFFRIKGQKSEYKFEELHKKFASESKAPPKSRYNQSSEVSLLQVRPEKKGLKMRCASAKTLLRVSTAFKRNSVVESKLSIGNLMIT